MQIMTDATILGIVNLEKGMMERADSHIQGWQRQVTRGDCFKRLQDGLEIYGEVLDDYDMKDMQNLRRCRCYSLACPEGEVGNIHVVTIDSLITRGTLEKVKGKLQKAWKMAMRKIEAEEYV